MRRKGAKTDVESHNATGLRARNAPKHPRPQRLGGQLTTEQRQAAQDIFLAAYARCGVVSWAASLAGVHRASVYRWLSMRPSFADRYKSATEEAIDALRAEAFRRAVVGWDEYVVSAGRVVLGLDGQPLMQRKYSGTLLLAMLKARVPEYFALAK